MRGLGKVRWEDWRIRYLIGHAIAGLCLGDIYVVGSNERRMYTFLALIFMLEQSYSPLCFFLPAI